MMERPKVISTEAESDFALQFVDKLFHAELDTPEGRELEAWITLIVDYEDRVYPIGCTRPKPPF